MIPPTESELRIVAVVSAYNEVDIIEQTLQDMIDQGISVYLLDNGSTDGTAEAVRHLVGRGLLAIEELQGVEPGRFELERIVARKAEVVASFEADWVVNHDADEIREAPWPGLTFAEGVAHVDRLGYNAIDFVVLNFPPLDDSFVPGKDLRSSFPYFEIGSAFDRLQIRCWKNQPHVDLESTAGHEARFEGRRVFPIPFLLRHYPIRSQQHGERKVFGERIPRFSSQERDRKWHVQYDGMEPGHNFLRDPDSLTLFDSHLTRVQLLLECRTNDEKETRRLQEERERLLQAFAHQTDALQHRTEELAICERRVEELLNSWSWRATLPLRRLLDLFKLG